jgi:hypothetical protein
MLRACRCYVYQEHPSFRALPVGTVEMKWAVTVVWSVPTFEAHWACLVLGWVTSDTDCTVGTEGNIFGLMMARILLLERVCVFLLDKLPQTSVHNRHSFPSNSLQDPLEPVVSLKTKAECSSESMENLTTTRCQPNRGPSFCRQLTWRANF